MYNALQSCAPMLPFSTFAGATPANKNNELLDYLPIAVGDCLDINTTVIFC